MFKYQRDSVDPVSTLPSPLIVFVVVVTMGVSMPLLILSTSSPTGPRWEPRQSTVNEVSGVLSISFVVLVSTVLFVGMDGGGHWGAIGGVLVAGGLLPIGYAISTLPASLRVGVTREIHGDPSCPPDGERAEFANGTDEDLVITTRFHRDVVYGGVGGLVLVILGEAILLWPVVEPVVRSL